MLADVSCTTGLWNRDNSILLKYPSQRHLSWSCAVSDSHCLQGRMFEDSPLFNRRVGHDRNMTLATPRQQIVFGAASCQVVQHLIGREISTFIQGCYLFHI